MNYNFADKMNNVKFSAIRAVRARATGNGTYSDAISFAGGFPDPKAIPTQSLVTIANEVFTDIQMKSQNMEMLKGILVLWNQQKLF